MFWPWSPHWWDCPKRHSLYWGKTGVYDPIVSIKFDQFMNLYCFPFFITDRIQKLRIHSFQQKVFWSIWLVCCSSFSVDWLSIWHSAVTINVFHCQKIPSFWPDKTSKCIYSVRFAWKHVYIFFFLLSPNRLNINTRYLLYFRPNFQDFSTVRRKTLRIWLDRCRRITQCI